MFKHSYSWLTDRHLAKEAASWRLWRVFCPLDIELLRPSSKWLLTNGSSFGYQWCSKSSLKRDSYCICWSFAVVTTHFATVKLFIITAVATCFTLCHDGLELLFLLLL